MFQCHAEGGGNKGGRKQMRANANKRRQTLTNASKRRGENASKRKQTRATVNPPPFAIPLIFRCEPLSPQWNCGPSWDSKTVSRATSSQHCAHSLHCKGEAQKVLLPSCHLRGVPSPPLSLTKKGKQCYPRSHLKDYMSAVFQIVLHFGRVRGLLVSSFPVFFSTVCKQGAL